MRFSRQPKKGKSQPTGVLTFWVDFLDSAMDGADGGNGVFGGIENPEFTRRIFSPFSGVFSVGFRGGNTLYAMVRTTLQKDEE